MSQRPPTVIRRLPVLLVALAGLAASFALPSSAAPATSPSTSPATSTAASTVTALWAPSSGSYGPVTGEVHFPAVLRKVRFDSIRTTDYRTGRVQAVGRVFPGGSKVHLQRWVAASKTWKTIGTASPSGTAVTINATVRGSVLRYRLYAPAAFPYAAGISAERSHQQFMWRGVFKKPLLAWGGTKNPVFRIIPASEVPDLSEAELLTDRAGTVWGDLNTSGCTRIRAWLGNLTDGTVRTSLLRGSTVLGAVNQPRESETQLVRPLNGSSRTRLQVQDKTSGYGPMVSTDTYVLCNN